MTPSKIAVVAAALACVFALSACANTIRGIGKDASNTVDATQGAVNDVAE